MINPLQIPCCAIRFSARCAAFLFNVLKILPLLLLLAITQVVAAHESPEIRGDTQSTGVSSAPDTCGAFSRRWDSPSYSIPFDWHPPREHIILIQASINGSAPLPFMFDTGFNTALVVFKWAAGATHVFPNGKNGKTSFGDVKVQQTLPVSMRLVATPSTEDATMAFDSAVLMEEPDDVAMTTGPRIAGFIGAGILKLATVKIDFDSKTLILSQPGDKSNDSLPTDIATRIPLVPRSPEAGPGEDIKAKLAPGLEATLTIDTGAVFTSVSKAIFDKCAPLDKAEAPISILSGTFNVRTLLTGNLVIGGNKVPLVDLYETRFSGDGSLGMDVIARYNLIIDDQDGFVAFLPRKNYNSYMHGNVGSLYTEAGGTLTLTTVSLSSPAAQAHLLPGDRIVAVDGLALAPLSVRERIAALDGFAWTTSLLDVERHMADGSTKRFKATITRDSPFPLLRHCPAGFTVIKQPRQPAIVVEVEPGSVAEKAGLSGGDAVDAIDGMETKGMLPVDLGNVLCPDKSATLELTVRGLTGNPRRIKIAVAPPVGGGDAVR